MTQDGLPGDKCGTISQMVILRIVVRVLGFIESFWIEGQLHPNVMLQNAIVHNHTQKAIDSPLSINFLHCAPYIVAMMNNMLQTFNIVKS